MNTNVNLLSSRSVLHRVKKVSKTSCKENQKTFCTQKHFCENRALCEMVLKSISESEKPHMKI
jgi:hypothetical protein